MLKSGNTTGGGTPGAPDGTYRLLLKPGSIFNVNATYKVAGGHMDNPRNTGKYVITPDVTSF